MVTPSAVVNSISGLIWLSIRVDWAGTDLQCLMGDLEAGKCRRGATLSEHRSTCCSNDSVVNCITNDKNATLARAISLQFTHRREQREKVP